MGNNGKQWSGRSRGGGFGYNFFILLMKVAGIRSAYAFLSLVVVYFIPFASRATRAVWFYNRRILGYGRLRAAVKLYAHYYALGQTIIDRVAIGSGMERKYKFEFENYDAFLRVLDGGRGAVIIGAHVGCWGTGAGFFGDYARRMHLVMYDAELRQIKNVMDKHCKQEGYKVIAVNEGGIESILRIKEVLDRKEYVCFQGDRFVEGSPTVTLPFMGHEAPFPAGAVRRRREIPRPGGLLLCHARTRQALPLHLRHPGRAAHDPRRRAGQLRTLARSRGETLPAAMVQLLSVLVVSACSILLVSANRHTSPYPVYPLGLSYLKTYLERTISGIRVDIADCNLLSDAQLAERIRTLAPRYIGLSLRNVDGANSLDRRGFLPQYKALADVIRTASDAPLIIGGAGFSIFPEAFMRELGADYGIHGEGEGPLAELIGALERGRTEIDIPSVYTRDGRRGSGRRSYLPSIEVQFEPELTGYYWKQSGMLNITDQAGVPLRLHLLFVPLDRRAVRADDGSRGHRRKYPARQARLRDQLPVFHRLGVQHRPGIQRPAGRDADPPPHGYPLGRLLLAAGHRRRADAAVPGFGAYAHRIRHRVVLRPDAGGLRQAFHVRDVERGKPARAGRGRLLRPLPDPGRLRRHARKRARNDRKLAGGWSTPSCSPMRACASTRIRGWRS